MAVATVRIDPQASYADIDDTFNVEVWVDYAEDLGGFEFQMSYSSNIVEVQTAVLGAFLGSTGRSSVALGPNIDGPMGVVRFGGYSVGSQAGANGTGKLATITVKAVGDGTTVLQLFGVEMLGTDSAPQSTTVENGSITIGGLVSYRHGENSYTGGVDTYLYSAAPTANYSGNRLINVLWSTDQSADVVGLVDFHDIIDLVGTTILWATLEFYVYDVNPIGSDFLISVSAVRRPWVDTEATWEKAATSVSWALGGCQHVPLDREGESLVVPNVEGSLQTAYVTDILQGWASGEPQEGFLLQVSLGTCEGGLVYHASICSNDQAVVGHRPKLTIKYAIP